MERDESNRGVLNTLREAYHRNALDAAIFFGRPSWAGKEAKALGLNAEEQHEAMTQAHISAASRSEIIHGDHEKAAWHVRQAFNVPDEHPTS